MKNNYRFKTKELKPFQKIALFFWLGILVVAIFFQIFCPQCFSVKIIADLLSANRSSALVIFLILVCFRPLILIPGSILTFAGLPVFDAWTVFIVSMIGVAVSGTGIYFLAEILGFAQILETRFPSQIKKLKPRIEKHGNWFIAVWSAFPFVPDDLICYLSGSLRFPFLRFILAFTIGGALPIAVYSFGGNTILNLLGLVLV